jgi:hypothetical protein
MGDSHIDEVFSTKQSHTWAAWTKVIITSNRHPSTWYDKFQWEEDKALQRRIHHIWEAIQDMFGITMKCDKTGDVKLLQFDE